MKRIVKVLIVFDVIIGICFFLTYGPIKYFREFLITTAMTTKSHKYLAKTFYSDKMINKVLNSNYVPGFDEDTNPDEIVIGGNNDGHYSSVYEKEILDRKKGADYKLIEFKHNGYKVYLTAIYDPSKVSLAGTSYLGTNGELLTEITEKNNAKVAINAGGFYDPSGTGNGGVPMGGMIQNGKVVWNGGGFGTLVGFNKDNILVSINDTPENAVKKGMRDGVQFGPTLIMNGKAAEIVGNGGWGINPRTAIAQRKDGIVLFLIVDGNGTKYNLNGRGGVTMNELIEILLRYGAYNAANMDGGASTTFSVEGKLYNKPCAYTDDGQRGLPNAWVLK